jgi:spore coat protein JB
MNKERQMLYDEICAYDFALLDLQLFLDTHPYNECAIKDYKTALDRSNELRFDYQEKYGPLTTQYAASDEKWQWIDNPWPWDSEVK